MSGSTLNEFLSIIHTFMKVWMALERFSVICHSFFLAVLGHF